MRDRETFLDWELLPATEFASHSEQWQNLNAAHLGHVLLHPDFISTCLRHFGHPGVVLAVGKAGTQVRAMLLLARHGRIRWSSFSPSQLPIAPVVAAPGLALPDMLDSLVASLPPYPGLVAIEHLDPMLHPRPRDGARSRSLDYIDTCEIVVNAGTRAAYFRALSGNLVANIRKRRKRAERQYGQLALEVVLLPHEVEAAVARYADLESSGWKSSAGTALRRGDAQSRFYTDLLQRYAARGQGAVLLLRFDQLVAAARLVIWQHGMGVILKTAFNESLRAYAPGQLLLHDTLEYLLSSVAGLQRIETYGPANELQRGFATSLRTLYHLNVYRDPWLRRAHKLSIELRDALAMYRARAAPAMARLVGDRSWESLPKGLRADRPRAARGFVPGAATGAARRVAAEP